MLYSLGHLSLRNLVDILLVAVMLYYVLKSLSHVQALPVIRGFIIIFAITLIAGYFNLDTLKTILENVVSLAILAILILYPSEVRKILYSVGHTAFWGKMLHYEEKLYEKIITAAEEMAATQTGALIVIERTDVLQSLTESGVTINSEIEKNLILAIFQVNSPLHDGAILIRGNKIVAASCVIAHLSSNELDMKYGTRHRAAIGLSEQSDAAIIVVSEERGEISLVLDGKLINAISAKTLLSLLIQLDQSKDKKSAEKRSAAKS